MADAVIGLGANLGDRLAALQGAVDALSLLPGTKVTKVSAVYETDPVGYAAQPNFYNGAAVLSTALSPHTLLGALLGIEAAAGRVRRMQNGPRTLDLDLLLYDGAKCDDAELTLPHPRMLERGFVLVPLLELYPKGTALSLPFRETLDKMGQSGVRKTGHRLVFSELLPESSHAGREKHEL